MQSHLEKELDNWGPNWNSIGSSLGIILVIILMLSLSIASCIYIYENGLNGPPIRSDGFGYHAYLSSIFIDHDLSFRSAIAQVPLGVSPIDAYGLGLHPVSGKMFIKYLPGTALLGVPFFIVGDVFAQILELPRTGYSEPYQIANVAAGIFYLCLGMSALYAMLRRAHHSVAGMVLLLVVFATNVFHYGTYDGSFSHIYSFAVVSIYVLMLQRYRESDPSLNISYVIALGALMGLITLIRVPNAILGILAVGLIIEKNWRSTKQNRLTTSLLAFGVAGFIGILPLLAYWHQTTGNFLLNSYAVFPRKNGGVEGFRWGSPEIFNFLFSVDRGLFFWAPVILIGFLGLPKLFNSDKLWGGLVSIVLGLHIYVCSSWWAWNFGGSFGSRPFVEMMPLVAMPLAISMMSLKRVIGIPLAWLFTFMLVVLNLVLTYSYWHQYIPFNDTTLEILLKLPSKLFD